jgi:hypothetical protein
MQTERLSHPNNWILYEFFDKTKTRNTDLWWEGISSVIETVRNLEDYRPANEVCYFAARGLMLRKKSHPDESPLIDAKLEELDGIWKREIKKARDWTDIPRFVLQYYKMMGAIKSEPIFDWGLKKMNENLPRYESLAGRFPDPDVTQINENTYEHNDDLFQFMFIPGGAEEALLISRKNRWIGQIDGWQKVIKYFDEFLIHVNFSAVDPRLIEEAYEYAVSRKGRLAGFNEIKRNYEAWKFARDWVNKTNPREYEQ